MRGGFACLRGFDVQWETAVRAVGVWSEVGNQQILCTVGIFADGLYYT